jgi:uncharacterized protein
VLRALLLILALAVATPAAAQNFPQLTGRVVDQADLLNPQQEAQLTGKLEALQQRSSRQLVVVTVPSLDGYDIADYGYQLGRHWGIGQRGANNGVLLIVAPNERKIRIEVGYGLEGILTDALSNQIITNEMRPRFRANDYPGGINAGADAIIQQLQAPPEAAEQRVVAAQQAENRRHAQRNRDGGAILPLVFWGFILLFVILPIFGAGLRGRRHRRNVAIWGPGTGSRGGSDIGWFLAGMALNSLARGSRRGGGWGGGGGSWGGGGGSWGGGGGGFSGGGGSFGGGGASGGW